MESPWIFSDPFFFLVLHKLLHSLSLAMICTESYDSVGFCWLEN